MLSRLTKNSRVRTKVARKVKQKVLREPNLKKLKKMLFNKSKR
jgi:hypothetical protein